MSEIVKTGVRLPLLLATAIVGSAIWIIQRAVPKCSCNPKSSNWTRPFSGPVESLEGAHGPYVCCLKHGAHRAYDTDQMRILTLREERQVLRAIRKVPI
jgi:hypothetical protein